MWLLIVPTLGFTACGQFLMDPRLLGVALSLIVTTFTVGLIQWVISLNTRCPMCLTRLMVGQRCSKNRKAKDLLGSYRLRVACCVAFKRQFCCPYCGESTVVAVRHSVSR